MAGKTAPFARFEWMIAWRYMRAKRAEGGVSIMTWISLIGVTLAVFALIAVLAVRSGFRADFVDTIVGANAHLTVRQNYMETVTVTQGDQSVDVTRRIDTIADGDALAAQLRQIDGVTRAAPIIRGEGLATVGSESSFVQIYGITPADLAEVEDGDVESPRFEARGRRRNQARLAAVNPRRGREPSHRNELAAEQAGLPRRQQRVQVRRLRIGEAGNDGYRLAAAGRKLHVLVLVTAAAAG